MSFTAALTNAQVAEYLRAGYTAETLLQYFPGWQAEHLYAYAEMPMPVPVAPPVPNHQPLPGYQAPADSSGGVEVSEQFKQRMASALPGSKRGNAAGRPLPLGKHVVGGWSLSLQKTFYGEAFIFEFDAVSSSNPETEIGGRYSWTSFFDNRYPDYFWNDIHAIVGPLRDRLKGPGDSISRADLEWAIGSSQPVRGVRWQVEREDRKSQNSDNIKKLCKHWQIVDESIVVQPAPAAPMIPPLPPVPPMPPAVAPAIPTAPLPPLPGATAGLPPLPPQVQPMPPRPANWPAHLPWPPQVPQ